ncbi:MAG: CHAT domain-containing protein [Symploca sp. SIO3E6]|nr:CHAT domain-containing protein [Caldora sp. SIO3E6]
MKLRIALYQVRIITYNSLLPCNLLSYLLPSALCLLPYCSQSVSIQPNLILAIAAPTDLDSVVYQKVQEVLEKLAQSQSEQIELLPIVNPATPEAIDAVLEQQPHIFHFIGHGCLNNETGKEIGQIALVDDVFEEALWVDAGFFGGLFNRYRPGIVMLQACEGGMLSASQAFVGVASKIVQQNIPVVVAMQYEVSNITASCFAYRFYERLAQDDPVDLAAQNGRRAIANF